MESQTVSLYQSIDDLPLSNFITCLVDNNLNALVKSGLPSSDQLQSKWMEILTDYTDAIGSNENKMSLSIYKECIALDCKLKIVHACVTVLEGDYEETLAMMLNQLCKCNYSYQGENKIKELKSALARSKSIKIALDMKLLDFEGMREKQTKNDNKPTRKYFISVLIFLSNHAKYAITDTISVAEYCERVRQYNIFCEQSKPKSHGRR